MAAIHSVELVIGLEVHVQLGTRTKMFARAPSLACATATEGSGPNTAIDPVVLGLPGALPVPNAHALELAARVGLALGCAIAPHGFTRWDRKSYFYPDLPKGYQISQLDYPICGPGVFELPSPLAASGGGPVGMDWAAPPRAIRITRAHLEEDAGKLLHEAPAVHGSGPRDIDFSIVDFNRAGTALLEIVSEPDFRTADEVVLFCQSLRHVCRYVGASPGVLQKGHMRFEPNINCRLTLDDGRVVATPVIEVKNLNSFKAVRGAIEFESREQPRRWQQDARVHGAGTKSTRGWDDESGTTFIQREKEDAHDYRYFPDPDLPTVAIDAAWIDARRREVPALPLARQRRYEVELGLSAKEASALTIERDDSDLFEGGLDAARSRGVEPAKAARMVANLLLQSAAKRRGTDESTLTDSAASERRLADMGVSGPQLGTIAALRDAGTIFAAGADTLFGTLCQPDHAGRGTDPESLARQLGLIVIRDDAAMEAWADAAIQAQPQAAADVRAGKDAAIGRIVGAAMKASWGKADAGRLKEIILAKLRHA